MHATRIERPSRLLVVANAKSRNGGGPLDAALKRFDAAGIGHELVRPDGPSDMIEAIRDARDRVDAVVVAGGDGTMNAAAPAIIETHLPLGVLPAGTANDLARTLGLPVDLAAAADVIAAGGVTPIDLGEVNGHPFFNVASLGLSAELARRLSGEDKRRFGRLSYALAALRTLVAARPFHAEITEEGGAHVRVKTLQIAVGNGRYYGGGMAVTDDALIDDGHLDLYSLEMKAVWKLALMLPSFRAGRHGLWREVRTARGTRFRVRTRKHRPVNTDGELVTFTPAEFRILPRAVRVFVPMTAPG